MLDIEKLQKQIEFCRLIDKEKQITRQTPLADGSRKENDAEHAWHMAVMTLILSEYANEKIDVSRTIYMLLIHDLVEIYCGDTFAYDDKATENQHEREQLAADKLFAVLPEEQGRFFRELWDEFEERRTPESKFARSMDNFQPAMLNSASGGISWIENKVKLSQVLRRNSITHEGSETLWEYQKENFLKPAVDDGAIIKDTEF